MKIGILALQGCVEPHEEILRKLGIEPVRVRHPQDLEGLAGIILPGGESTTMLKLLKKSRLFETLGAFGKVKPVWGICAGAILLAERVVHPEQESLALMPIEAHRNYYGCQLDSFSTTLDFPKLGFTAAVDFIRAPRLYAKDKDVEVLAMHNGEEVLLRKGNLLAASFHIELSGATCLHEYFLRMSA